MLTRSIAVAFALLGVNDAFATPCTGNAICVDTGTSILCDLNVKGGSSATTLDVWHDGATDEYVFEGVDEVGAAYQCRFADWSATGGIDPDLYWIVVVGTSQNDQVSFNTTAHGHTYFTGFSFTAGEGNDMAIGPNDAHEIELDLGDGNDWVEVWGDKITSDLGAGNDAAMYIAGLGDVSVTYAGDGVDCVIGRPTASDHFWGEGDNDSLESSGTCGAGCPTETIDGGLGFDACNVGTGGSKVNCETPWTGTPSCPAYAP